MYFKQQQGGGLFNFYDMGSIVTLGAIAAVLFMLNQNNARDFQQPKMVNNPVSSEPAVLTPKPDMAASTTVANVETAASMVQPIPPVAANTQNTAADNEPIMCRLLLIAPPHHALPSRLLTTIKQPPRQANCAKQLLCKMTLYWVKQCPFLHLPTCCTTQAACTYCRRQHRTHWRTNFRSGQLAKSASISQT